MNPAPITGTASTVDGSVTVEVSIGGGLRAVRLTRSALDLGANRLAATVMAVAARATALANQRATLAFRDSADELLAGLGLSYPPELIDDDDTERGVLRR
ncbi:MAG TPA: YbaB/EbfC family DNA-binding protein [Pseudonocardiaceae bacterium]